MTPRRCYICRSTRGRSHGWHRALFVKRDSNPWLCPKCWEKIRGQNQALVDRIAMLSSYRAVEVCAWPPPPQTSPRALE